jgi:hypothetical protein
VNLMLFRRRERSASASPSALADPPRAQTARSDPPDPLGGAGEAELLAEIDRLTGENRARRSSEIERRLVRLRHILGMRLLAAGDTAPGYASPEEARLPAANGNLAEIAPDALTPELLRAGLLRDGCLLVRGLIDSDQALGFAKEIDRAFELRERFGSDGSATDGYYDEFVPQPKSGEPIAREWIKMGGGVLAVDSPRLAFELIDLLVSAGVPALVRGYLGEPPLISADKTTLRKALPSVQGAWHQDGAFMGEVRALNLWLSLSRCGDVAPGLDIVPRRLELVGTQTDEAMLAYQVSQRAAEEAAGDRPILRPIFEPGDALFFDDLFLHKTGSDPSMPNPRYAVESWFFGGSAFPREYSPVSV